MHRHDLMNPDPLSEIVLLTYADVLCEAVRRTPGKIPTDTQCRRVVALGTYQPRNRFASEACRTYREESRSPHSTQNQSNSIASRSWNTATGETTDPSPIYPLHCEALPRAEAAETR